MKQPRALIPLFSTELWERFGFYVIQGLLIIYLTKHLDFLDPKSYAIMGEFSALVYISPIVGGFLADRVMGFRYAILWGAIFLCLGYAMLAMSETYLLYLGLATIILGNGFLKPNISSYLGEFYEEKDPRREAGFTLFYIGINLGAALANLSSGFIQEKFGWGICFGSAAFGLLIAIATFYLGFRSFGNKGLPHHLKNTTKTLEKYLQKTWMIILIMLGIVAISYLMIKHPGFGNTLLMILGIVLLITLLYLTTRYPQPQKKHLFALIILIAFSIIFWAFLFQIFFSVNLFVERSVDRLINIPSLNIHLHLPAPVFLSMESIFIILLGVPMASLWQKLQQKKRNPSLGVKFSLSFFSTAISMFVLFITTHLINTQHQVQPTWMIFVYLFITIGEMLLSPIGLAMITQFAPAKLKGFMMGIWFMSIGFGASLAGWLSQQASVPKHLTDSLKIIAIYRHAFWHYTLIALATGIVLLLLSPWLKKLTASG